MTAGLYRVLSARVVHGDHQEAHPGDDIMLSGEDARSLLKLGAVMLTSECDPAPADELEDAPEATLFGEALPLSSGDADGSDGELEVALDEGEAVNGDAGGTWEPTGTVIVTPETAPTQPELATSTSPESTPEPSTPAAST